MTAHLVYVQGLRGPEPQIWHVPMTDGQNKEKPYLCKRELSETEAMVGLADLERRYPPPSALRGDGSEGRK